MTATTHSTSLVPVQPAFTDAERLALAGFLAGYRGLTREAYTLDLRQFTGWCRARSLPLFSVRRADIETFARELEAPRPRPRHRHPAAVHHRRVLQVRRQRTSTDRRAESQSADMPFVRTRTGRYGSLDVGLAGCRVGSCGSWSEPSVKVVDDRSVARVSSAGIPVGALLGGSAAEDQPGQTPYRSDGERRSGRLWTMSAVHARSLRL